MRSCISLDELVERLDDRVEIVEFLAPAVCLESERACWGGLAPTCVAWRAAILLETDAYVGDPSIVVGHVDFVMLPTGFEDIADNLEELEKFVHLDVERFSPLFDGAFVAADVETMLIDFEVVMLVVDVSVHELFRGHRIGAWAVAQTIQLMMPVTTGLVALCPHVAEEEEAEPSIDRIEAIDQRNRHWKRVGLTPLRDDPSILVAATGGRALSEAFLQLHQRYYGSDEAGVEEIFVPAQALIRRSPWCRRRLTGWRMIATSNHSIWLAIRLQRCFSTTHLNKNAASNRSSPARINSRRSLARTSLLRR